MRPFFFGRSDQLLFGAYHGPAVRTARPSAVLLCNPFGQEAIRAHRIYGTLAGKLSKCGHHVLRFDYYGTGDSAGEVEEGRQEAWLEDILEAHEELQASSGASRVAWVGLRYGASLAVLASQSLRRPISGLILWDPVVDGAAYLRELGETHADCMRAGMRNWRPSAPAGSECLGFPLGGDLKRAIATIDLAHVKHPRARQVAVVTTTRDAGSQRFRNTIADWSGANLWTEVTTGSPWNSEKAMNAMLVPMDVLDTIVTRVQEVP